MHTRSQYVGRPGSFGCRSAESASVISQSSRPVEFSGDAGKTVSFLDHFVSSERFSELFREGMTLVEETARYLDGDGRREGRGLAGPSSLAFTTESMRLTTRLMNLASWLLLRRSLSRGEISIETARRERGKLKLDSIGRPAHVKDFDRLPEKLRQLIELSFSLHDRISRLDRSFEAPAGAAAAPLVVAADQGEGRLERIRLATDGGKPVN